jgi:hypothetical protein
MQNLPKPVRKRGFDADFAYGPPKAYHTVGETPHAGRLYVDRFGREREDTYVMDGSKRELVEVDIWDVVAGRYYALLPQDKKILFEDLLDPQEGRVGLDIKLPGIISVSLPRHSLSSKNQKELGTRRIEGLMCQRAVKESPISESPRYGKVPGFVIEYWYAEEIAYVVLVNTVWTLPDGGKVETTFRMSEFQFREPSPELFQVPPDYKPAKLVPIKN